MTKKESFGLLPDGREVSIFTINNAHGEYVQFLDYGASIHALVVKDRNGVLTDTVLGAKDAEGLAAFSYLGATIGRCANRIAHGRCTINGKEVELECNMRGHFLHGASGNYAKKIFDGRIDETTGNVVFYLKDTGEGGFNNNVDVTVTYSFGDDSVLRCTYYMVPEEDTVLNPTNHTYFSLGAHDSRQLALQVAASRMVSRDEEGIPNGDFWKVEGTPADFTDERLIQDAMGDGSDPYFAGQAPGYDEFYILDKDLTGPAAGAYNPANGIRMSIYTKFPGMVVFVNGARRACEGKNGDFYEGYRSVAIEPGFVPNAVNCPAYDSPVFLKGQALYQTVEYRFSAE